MNSETPLPLDPTIFYLLATSDIQPDQATPLQGFSLGLCRDAWLIRVISRLPSNIYDFATEGQKTFLERRIGGNCSVNWYPQSPNAIRSVAVPENHPFTVIVLGEGHDPKDYADWANACGVKPIIVAKTGGDINYEEFDIEGLQRQFLLTCDEIPIAVSRADIDRAKDCLQGWSPLIGRNLGYQVEGHASVLPNLSALAGFGFDDLTSGPMEVRDGDIQLHVDQIVQTANSIFDERDRIGQRDIHRLHRCPPDLNIFAPAMFSDSGSREAPASLTETDKREFRSVMSILEKQKGYSYQLDREEQLKALVGLGEEELKSEGAEPKSHMLMQIRQQELWLGTECISSLAASEFSAVIRLPNDINRTSGAVRQFASHYRGTNTRERKRLSAFRKMQKRLSQAIPADFLDLIRRSSEGVRIVSDAHIEWMDIDGLPLSIRKNVSRIPVTPGNLFVDQVTTKPTLHLTPDDFRDVLIISALERSDPISGFFDIAFEIFGEHWKDKLNVVVAEVSSADDFVKALNDFDGAMVVFDGHGSHAIDGSAKLHLRGVEIDVWDLRGSITRPPPIVVLSACDTHAADRNHATTVNGFLSIGTRTVLGSVFPLDARSAAAFTARLLYRVSTFVPAAIGLFDRAITWTEVVSGMLRMQLMTDFLRLLRAKNMIDHHTYMEVHKQGNFAINGNSEDPFQDVLSLLEERGLEARKLKNALDLAVSNSSVISCVSVGRPETIQIDTQERVAEQVDDLFLTSDSQGSV